MTVLVKNDLCWSLEIVDPSIRDLLSDGMHITVCKGVVSLSHGDGESVLIPSEVWTALCTKVKEAIIEDDKQNPRQRLIKGSFSLGQCSCGEHKMDEKFICPMPDCGEEQTMPDVEVGQRKKYTCTECKSVYTIIKGSEEASFDDIPVT